MSNEQDARIEALEVKLAYQEDTVQALNLRVYEQQKEIDELKELNQLMLSRMQDISLEVQQQDRPKDEKPPHY